MTSIHRTVRRVIRRRGAMLALLALVLAAPAAAATADKPVPGGIYASPGSGRQGAVMIFVGPQGASAKVKWMTEGLGCTGGLLQFSTTVTIRPDGSFHGALRKLPSWYRSYRVKQFLAETRGQFVAKGQAVSVSIRVKADLSTQHTRMVCDGRWLKLKALRARGD